MQGIRAPRLRGANHASGRTLRPVVHAHYSTRAATSAWLLRSKELEVDTCYRQIGLTSNAGQDEGPNHEAQVSSRNFFYISLSFQIEPAMFTPERLVLVCSLQVNNSIKSAPKSARSPVAVQSARESVDWPTFGLLPRLAPRTACHVHIKQPHPMQSSTTVASSVPLGTRKNVSNRLPCGRKFHANVRVLTGQTARRSLACMQAYHSEGTNIAKVGSLGEPRASHTICSIQAFWWEDDGYYQGSRSNVIPRFRVLGKRPLLLAARSFHRIELYLASSSH